MFIVLSSCQHRLRSLFSNCYYPRSGIWRSFTMWKYEPQIEIPSGPSPQKDRKVYAISPVSMMLHHVSAESSRTGPYLWTNFPQHSWLPDNSPTFSLKNRSDFSSSIQLSRRQGQALHDFLFAVRNGGHGVAQGSHQVLRRPKEFEGAREKRQEIVPGEDSMGFFVGFLWCFNDDWKCTQWCPPVVFVDLCLP